MIHSASVDELVEFFDTHDLGEYWDEMSEAHFEVDIKTKTHIGNQGCNTQFCLECNGEVKGWRYCHDDEILPEIKNSLCELIREQLGLK